MRQRIYAMEPAFLRQLLEDRQELFSVARSLGSAEEMRQARAEFMADARVNIAPASGEQPEYTIDDEGTAHIPVVGELTPQAKTDICGAYTAEALTEYGYIREATLAANADSRVKQLQYNVDSPGGYYEGLAETADIIRASEKPTRAIIGSLDASAAYWLASQTDWIEAASIGSRVGSIGVAVEEYDDSQRLENAGITRRVYTSTDAPDKRPDTSTEEGQAKIVGMLDEMHNVFTRYVSEGRGVDADTVRSEFGRGGLVMAEQAVERGMIDAVATVPARTTSSSKTSGVAGEKHSRQEAGNSREVPTMDRNQLRTEHPDLYEELKQEHTEAGVKQERTRISRLQAYSDADPQNAKLAEVVKTAIANGSAIDDVRPQLDVALRDGAKLDGENPPDVGSQVAGSEDEDDAKAKELAAQMFGGGK